MHASFSPVTDVSYRIDRGDIRTHCGSGGRCFVYVLPCREQDLLKIGFSRTPLERFQTLHPRYFEYFDIDAGALIEVERVRDARRIERELLAAFAPQRAPAPCAVPRAAAGHTEWRTGVRSAALDRVTALCTRDDLRLHAPLRGWLRSEVGARLPLLFDWSRAMLETIEYERFNPTATATGLRCTHALRDVLDACRALDLALDAAVPDAVSRWHDAMHGAGT